MGTLGILYFDDSAHALLAHHTITQEGWADTANAWATNYWITAKGRESYYSTQSRHMLEDYHADLDELDFR